MNSSLGRKAASGLEEAGREALSALNTASEGRTPAGIVARLVPDPGEAPEGCTRLIGDDVTIGMLVSGDWLGIDGRWCLVVGCTSVNGWVSVDTAHGHPSLPGAVYLDASVHLARNIDLEGVEV